MIVQDIRNARQAQAAHKELKCWEKHVLEQFGVRKLCDRCNAVHSKMEGCQDQKEVLPKDISKMGASASPCEKAFRECDHCKEMMLQPTVGRAAWEHCRAKGGGVTVVGKHGTEIGQLRMYRL